MTMEAWVNTKGKALKSYSSDDVVPPINLSSYARSEGDTAIEKQCASVMGGMIGQGQSRACADYLARVSTGGVKINIRGDE